MATVAVQVLYHNLFMMRIKTKAMCKLHIAFLKYNSENFIWLKQDG